MLSDGVFACPCACSSLTSAHRTPNCRGTTWLQEADRRSGRAERAERADWRGDHGERKRSDRDEHSTGAHSAHAHTAQPTLPTPPTLPPARCAGCLCIVPTRRQAESEQQEKKKRATNRRPSQLGKEGWRSNEKTGRYVDTTIGCALNIQNDSCSQNSSNAYTHETGKQKHSRDFARRV